ncbi:type II toxin-antitoxin system mRNA interferase toxin, RelE/StbE family [Candidatus Parcubacteria bacterium]|nr:MAG: type II toxin-antitoxin system mRNA interferase toxin, RelE/StbE family [Candidatus Parcubacteria bacterium]
MGIDGYKIIHHPLVIQEDIPRLDKAWKLKVRDSIRQKLMSHPELYGKALHQDLKGFRKLRVGDYRVIYQVAGKNVRTLIIGHRSIVYRDARKRLVSSG